MKIFVTGGTGFVGSHVVDVLSKRGHQLVCLVRDSRKAAEVLRPLTTELVTGDLNDTGALERGCASADAIVHLAALTAARCRAELFTTNAAGTRAVVDAARTRGTRIQRFVFVSSLAAAGPATHGPHASTGDETHPVSDYGRSKIDGEAAVRALPLPWTILRPPAVYGPRDTEFLRLFRIARHGFAPLFGDGSQQLSMVFVRDLATAIADCLESAIAPGTYYPAHREITTARALVERIAATLGVPVRIIPIPRSLVRPILWVSGSTARLSGRATLLGPDKAGEILAPAWTCSPAAFESAAGWSAATDLAEGLRHTADWYRAAGWM